MKKFIVFLAALSAICLFACRRNFATLPEKGSCTKESQKDSCPASNVEKGESYYCLPCLHKGICILYGSMKESNWNSDYEPIKCCEVDGKVIPYWTGLVSQDFQDYISAITPPEVGNYIKTFKEKYPEYAAELPADFWQSIEDNKPKSCPRCYVDGVQKDILVEGKGITCCGYGPPCANPSDCIKCSENGEEGCQVPGQTKCQGDKFVTPVSDHDGDGVVDNIDNCWEVSNSLQEDLDKDGIGDSCDNDLDGDNILDSGAGGPCKGGATTGCVDNCPHMSNSDQANIDGDAYGDVCDLDRDGDCILDSEDECPEVKACDEPDLCKACTVPFEDLAKDLAKFINECVNGGKISIPSKCILYGCEGPLWDVIMRETGKQPGASPFIRRGGKVFVNRAAIPAGLDPTMCQAMADGLSVKAKTWQQMLKACSKAKQDAKKKCDNGCPPK